MGDVRRGTRQWRRLRAAILARDGYACRMVEGCRARATHVDHIVPVVLGGSSHPDNLRAACAVHNLAAGGALASRTGLGSPSRAWVL